MQMPVSMHDEVDSHSLSLNRSADSRRRPTRAAHERQFLVEAPAGIVTCGVLGGTSGGYGKRAEKYVHMEVGHAGKKPSSGKWFWV
jgi:hypothetical protein